ncbi:MAG TPA: alkaline phosphatase PhoX [Solirubrobacteraceae bacterium]|nr:alkaline phosphatase PhoX [Solirubrobacteraceae bacterium]
MLTDRREFLKRAGYSVAGLTALSGPLQAIFARGALAVGSTGVAANNGGYGPLVPVPDETDGVVRLHLPEGFEYRSITPTGTPMDDGVLTPGRHDGMAAFNAGPSRYRLVRNHEVNGPVGAFGDRSKAYDPVAGGGTTTLEVNRHASQVDSWVSCNGTQMNCAGGATPWGTWLTCEETVNGPDVGNDFTGGNNSLLTKKHGYVFEVQTSWDAGEHATPVPIRSAGRFAHEAVDIDPETGFLYLTEDNFDFPSGFYRYRAPQNPMTAKRLTDGGTLEMLKIAGRPNAVLDKGQTPGVTYGVEWVKIDDPDPTFAPGTTNNQAIVAVGDQGRAKGAATFSRLEGIFYDSGKIYLVSTQGGDTPAGEPPPAGYGDGFGQLWVYDTRRSTLTLLFESPSRTVLELPDNLCISPRKCALLCEDGPVENFLRGVTPEGEIFDFAFNAIAGRRQEEFAGSTFTPDGKVLFVNIQASSGLTFAIWGPWKRGVL